MQVRRGAFYGKELRAAPARPQCPYEWTSTVRFPDTQATPQKLRALEQLAVKFFRINAIRYLQAPVELMSEGFGLGTRAAQLLAREAATVIDEEDIGTMRAGWRGGANTRIVDSVLEGMLDGTYPPPLMCPRTPTLRWFFDCVSRFDYGLDYKATSYDQDEYLRYLYHNVFKRDYIDWIRGAR